MLIQVLSVMYQFIVFTFKYFFQYCFIKVAIQISLQEKELHGPIVVINGTPDLDTKSLMKSIPLLCEVCWILQRDLHLILRGLNPHASGECIFGIHPTLIGEHHLPPFLQIPLEPRLTPIDSPLSINIIEVESPGLRVCLILLLDNAVNRCSRYLVRIQFHGLLYLAATEHPVLIDGIQDLDLCLASEFFLNA